jgi:hypothetical protein
MEVETLLNEKDNTAMKKSLGVLRKAGTTLKEVNYSKEIACNEILASKTINLKDNNTE